ncbi:MAG: SDR family oxidoreductase [Nocardioides sp.]|uniref:SDR family NAD(P)-dependent oxidoreductase n=1 Tax=Nocardioides sp. TaxID=35761 RepID=UPI0039E64E58
MTTQRHADQIVVISGGAAGIGRAMVERLVDGGARVAVLDTAVTAGTAEGDRVLGVRCDIADPAAVRAARDQVIEHFGAVNALVHCAAHQVRRRFEELTEQDWRRTMSVNVDGAFHLLDSFLPAMKRAGWGRVVLVTSSSYYAPPPGMTHYIASKGALQGMVRGLADELGEHRITINALAPGLTRTEAALAKLPEEFFAEIASHQAIKRNGEPGDQAAALSFLLSRDADFMTGQTLLVDGGEGRV